MERNTTVNGSRREFEHVEDELACSGTGSEGAEKGRQKAAFISDSCELKWDTKYGGSQCQSVSSRLLTFLMAIGSRKKRRPHLERRWRQILVMFPKQCSRLGWQRMRMIVDNQLLFPVGPWPTLSFQPAISISTWLRCHWGSWRRRYGFETIEHANLLARLLILHVPCIPNGRLRTD